MFKKFNVYLFFILFFALFNPTLSFNQKNIFINKLFFGLKRYSKRLNNIFYTRLLQLSTDVNEIDNTVIYGSIIPNKEDTPQNEIITKLCDDCITYNIDKPLEGVKILDSNYDIILIFHINLSNQAVKENIPSINSLLDLKLLLLKHLI